MSQENKALVDNNIVLDIIDFSTKKKSSETTLNTIQVDKSITIQKAIIKKIIDYQLANKRLGTKRLRDMSDVSCSTRKPFKQKGTGRARQGSTRAPHMVGGGAAHQVKTVFSHKLPKKVRQLGLRCAILNKYLNEAITIVENFPLMDKTSDFLTAIANICNLNKYNNEKILLLSNESERIALLRLTGNLPFINVLPVIGLNVYDLIYHTYFVASKEAIIQLDENRL